MCSESVQNSEFPSTASGSQTCTFTFNRICDGKKLQLESLVGFYAALHYQFQTSARFGMNTNIVASCSVQRLCRFNIPINLIFWSQVGLWQFGHRKSSHNRGHGRWAQIFVLKYSIWHLQTFIISLIRPVCLVRWHCDSHQSHWSQPAGCLWHTFRTAQ